MLARSHSLPHRKHSHRGGGGGGADDIGGGKGAGSGPGGEGAIAAATVAVHEGAVGVEAAWEEEGRGRAIYLLLSEARQQRWRLGGTHERRRQTGTHPPPEPD